MKTDKLRCNGCKQHFIVYVKKELKSNIDKLLDKAKAEDKVIEIEQAAKDLEYAKNYYYGQGNPVRGFFVRKIWKFIGKDS